MSEIQVATVEEMQAEIARLRGELEGDGKTRPHRRRGKDPWKDRWRTPPEIFQPVNDRFRFALDVAASEENKLAPHFIDESRDALLIGWRTAPYEPLPRGSSGWMNPPYSKTYEFAERARDEARNEEIVVVGLLPSTTDVQWFHEFVLGEAAEVWHYTGRLAFVHPVTGLPVSGNAAGSMLVVWTPEGPSWAGTRFGSLCHVRGTPVRPEDVVYWNSRLTSTDAVLVQVPTDKPRRSPRGRTSAQPSEVPAVQ